MEMSWKGKPEKRKTEETAVEPQAGHSPRGCAGVILRGGVGGLWSLSPSRCAGAHRSGPAWLTPERTRLFHPQSPEPLSGRPQERGHPQGSPRPVSPSPAAAVPGHLGAGPGVREPGWDNGTQLLGGVMATPRAAGRV